MTRTKCGRPPLQARQDAIHNGYITYQGKPCRHGHDGIRYISTAKCIKCVSNYYKEYQTRNQPTEADRIIQWLRAYNKQYKITSELRDTHGRLNPRMSKIVYNG